MQRIFNISRRKVGGIWFVKLGRINISFSVSRPKRITDVQRMEYCSLRAARNLNEVERALTTRMVQLRQQGLAMEVNRDH
jgi:hypothetical protein